MNENGMIEYDLYELDLEKFKLNIGQKSQQTWKSIKNSKIKVDDQYLWLSMANDTWKMNGNDIMWPMTKSQTYLKSQQKWSKVKLIKNVPILRTNLKMWNTW